MICPHCDKDTPATLPYCQSCGLGVDLTFEKVQATFGEEATARQVRESDERCRSVLLGCATALLIAIAARLFLVPQVSAPPVLPPYLIAEPADVAAASPVPPLKIAAPPLDVPK